MRLHDQPYVWLSDHARNLFEASPTLGTRADGAALNILPGTQCSAGGECDKWRILASLCGPKRRWNRPNATPFWPKTTSNRRDGEKARGCRHLRVAYLCTKWRIVCTRRACVVRARGRIGPGRNLASAPRSLSPQRMDSEGPDGPERCVGQRH